MSLIGCHRALAALLAGRWGTSYSHFLSCVARNHAGHRYSHLTPVLPRRDISVN